ncbi:MAG: hypothetical protein V4692_02860 [Bdellovibrionota bacterium]
MTRLILILLFTLFATPAFAEMNSGFNSIDTETYLKDFHRDPKRVMNTPLAKVDEQGEVVHGYLSPLAEAATSLEDLIRAKRGAGNSDASDFEVFSSPDKYSKIEDFLYNPEYIRNLLEMEEAGLNQAVLPEPPWSDSFWPMTRGLIARRWSDPGFPNSKLWIDNYNYYVANPSPMMPVDQLSASEKYDLLMGDSAMTLTEKMWGAGKSHQEGPAGKVPSWAGLCDGWSPASIMTPNPKRSVTLTAADGNRITFNPSDIKAIASLAWAKSRPTIRQVGKRCTAIHPAEDQHGRVLDPLCFDVNPATWHIGVVHQIGVEKRGFVFDATYDQQVWNYPIYSYTYTYFNPQTLRTSKTMAGSAVRASDFTIDKFKPYRSSESNYIVGVAMDLSYAIPTQPSANPVRASKFHTVKYVYDLELDASGNIVGGEWYSNFHPDFIWNLVPDSRPISTGERGNELSWDGESPLPEEIRAAASKSSNYSQPVSAVLETMIRLAQ